MNERGQYGNRQRRWDAGGRGQYGRSFVGQGSLFGHTPGEVEDELDQLHSEIMQFGQEVIETIKMPAEARLEMDPEYRRLRAVEKAAEDFLNSIPEPPSAFEVALLAAQRPQEAIKFEQQRKARIAAVAKAREATEARASYGGQILSRPSPAASWAAAVWDPFSRSWLKWYREKKDIPWQTLPLSGVWDRIQEFRQKFIAIRRDAPFKTRTPEPLSPEGRKDPSLTRGARDIWGGIGGGIETVGSILKWAAVGVLGIGAIVALSSVATSWKKKEDPLEKYAGMLGRGSRTALPRATAREVE